MTEEFLASLIPLEPGAVERGDFVYELIRFGIGEKAVKANKLRVIEVERGCCAVVRADGEQRGRPRKIRFNDLRMEKPTAATAPAVTHKIAMPKINISVPPGADAKALAEVARATFAPVSEVDAWLEMGRGIVAGIERERTELADQRAKAEADVERVDSVHRANIERLEQQLESAKRQWRDDRALAETRVSDINVKLEHVGQRKQTLEKMLGGA